MLTQFALFVGGHKDGDRLAVKAHNPYYIFYRIDRVPPRVTYEAAMPIPRSMTTEDRYINAGLRVGDAQVYIFEPLLNANPHIHAGEVAIGMLIEGYRAPRAI